VETFIRYVKIQLFVFLCGIVGPIFLIVFFAVQPEPDTKWLYWAGLIVTTGRLDRAGPDQRVRRPRSGTGGAAAPTRARLISRPGGRLPHLTVRGVFLRYGVVITLPNAG